MSNLAAESFSKLINNLLRDLPSIYKNLHDELLAGNKTIASIFASRIIPQLDSYVFLPKKYSKTENYYEKVAILEKEMIEQRLSVKNYESLVKSLTTIFENSGVLKLIIEFKRATDLLAKKGIKLNSETLDNINNFIAKHAPAKQGKTGISAGKSVTE
jgi:hypothetical protein